MNDGSFPASAGSESFQAAPGAATSDGADQARPTAEQVLDEMKQRAADYFGLGRDKAAELTETVEQQIRSQPVKAVAIAAGIGFALGFIWTRRK